MRSLKNACTASSVLKLAYRLNWFWLWLWLWGRFKLRSGIWCWCRLSHANKHRPKCSWPSTRDPDTSTTQHEYIMKSTSNHYRDFNPRSGQMTQTEAQKLSKAEVNKACVVTVQCSPVRNITKSQTYWLLAEVKMEAIGSLIRWSRSLGTPPELQQMVWPFFQIRILSPNATQEEFWQQIKFPCKMKKRGRYFTFYIHNAGSEKIRTWAIEGVALRAQWRFQRLGWQKNSFHYWY